jgi:CBS-domain-containing membrane protein
MEILGTATQVTIYIGESDRWGQKPLYMAILELLKKEDCAGATVTRGVAGFGAHSRIRSASIVALSTDLPLRIEWVDDPARVDRILPRLIEMTPEGLITRQDVEVVSYSHRQLRELPAAAPVRDVMSREVQFVRPETPLAEAVDLLINEVFRALPVVDAEKRVVGILTDGDLLARLDLPNVGVQRALTEAEMGSQFAALRRAGLTVGEMMNPGVVTVAQDAPVADAVRLMTEREIKRLPVVDVENRLVGMVSRVDVLRALAQPMARELPRRRPRPGQQVQVGDVMMSEVPWVHAEDPLNKVVDLLIATSQRRVVVVDAEQRVIGIITDGDLLKRAGESARAGVLQALAARMAGDRSDRVALARRTAAEVMTRDPIAVGPETPLLEALQLLLAHKIKRLPVVDGAGKLVGLVGRGGILEALAREM